MIFEIKHVGDHNGRPVHSLRLANSRGMSATLLSYGCILQSLVVPDRNGVAADVVLGYEQFARYPEGHPFFGAIAGRFANRIREGRFVLDGKIHRLECNEVATGQHLHGGSKGFDKAVWGFDVEDAGNAVWVHFHHTSPNGDSGYPGRLDVVHGIGLDEDCRLHLDFRAVADQDTVINLVNHSYFNLAGAGNGTIEGHHLTLAADFVTPVGTDMIPTGEIVRVDGTAWDFRRARLVGEAMAARPERDFDNNFVVRKDPAADLSLAADLYHPESGRGMRVSTSQPGIQFYNGFKLGNREWIGKGGAQYGAFSGLCLETQHFPDSPNQPQFPSTVLSAGRLWEQRTIHAFYQR